MGQGKTGGSSTGGAGGSNSFENDFMSFLFGSPSSSHSSTGGTTGQPTTGITGQPTTTSGANTGLGTSLGTSIAHALGGGSTQQQLGGSTQQQLGGSTQQQLGGSTQQQPQSLFSQPQQSMVSMHQPIAQSVAPTQAPMASHPSTGTSVPGSKYVKMPDGSFQDPSDPNTSYYGSQPPDIQATMSGPNPYAGSDVAPAPVQPVAPVDQTQYASGGYGGENGVDYSQPDYSSYDQNSQPDYSSYDQTQYTGGQDYNGWYDTTPVDNTDYSNFDFGGGDFSF